MHAIVRLAIIALVAGSIPAFGQIDDFDPVTDEMLLNPDPADWLMINRTFDQQRFSPLDRIDRGNVSELALAWVRGLPGGVQESTPIIYDGVMFLIEPGAGVIAIDATNGDRIWSYSHEIPNSAIGYVGPPELQRQKNIGIYGDLIFYPAPDGLIVALDAATGEVRWQTEVFDVTTNTRHTGGVLVADGKVITNRACLQRAGCFISAHDALTGEEIWKFYLTAEPGTRDGDTWGNVPVDERVASSWGLPGSYDPVSKITYWGTANPTPYTRLTRHGSADAIPTTAPADLYSNSTVALDVETGELVWYYQHNPGDDWDLDHLHERTIISTVFEPDPEAVKWINPAIERGEIREAVVMVGEGGGIWMLDPATGQFLWATPFPYDVPEFHIADINVETGRTVLNTERMFTEDGQRQLVCYHNTRSYWSTAYDPTRNALYVPYHDACLDMTSNASVTSGFGPRAGMLRPGTDMEDYSSMAKIDLATGRMERIHSQPAPGNGSALVTAGDLLFWGDMARRFRAFDADDGEVLWEAVLGGTIQTSTITYAVDGRQYVAVLTGNGTSGTGTPASISGIEIVLEHNAVYAFALPQGYSLEP